MALVYPISYTPFFDNFNTDFNPALGGLRLPYDEQEYRGAGSPMEVYDRDSGGHATRILQVDWDDRNLAAQQILGYSECVDGKIRRHLPEFYPDKPWLVAVKISRVQGLGPLNTSRSEVPVTDFAGGRRMLAYKKANLWVEYDAVDYAIRSDDEIDQKDGDASVGSAPEIYRYVTPKMMPQSEFINIPAGGYRWVNGGQPGANTVFSLSVNKLYTTVDFELTWHQVPLISIPTPAILSTLGRVNKHKFINNDPHTTLLVKVMADRKRQPTGTTSWEITYAFKFNPLGFNKFYYLDGNVADLGPFTVTIDGTTYTPPGTPEDTLKPTGYQIFDEAHYINLFRPDPTGCPTP